MIVTRTGNELKRRLDAAGTRMRHMNDGSPTTASGSLVELTVDEGIAVVTLNDPGRRNCVSAKMSSDLADVCDLLNGNPALKVVILTGAGPVFSAGGDVDSLNDPNRDLGVLYRGFSGLGSLAVPTIAAVNGPAVGAGANFALACDLIIAGRSARFDPLFLDVGIHPGGGHLWRLNRLVGRQATCAMVIFGERLTADEAETRGLIWRAVDDADLMSEARRLAEKVASRSPELVRRTKATLRASLPIMDERLAIDLEQIAQEWSMDRPAFVEAARKLRDRVRRGSK